MLTRHQIRRTVLRELRNARTYRQALRSFATPDCASRERMEKWVRVADELLEMLRSEPGGDAVSQYADDLFGITCAPRGNRRYVNMRACNRYHISEDGLRRWREAAIYNASVLAFIYHAIDLSDDA